MTAAPVRSFRRRWLFRLALLLSAPALIVFAEAAVRLTGWGMPPPEQMPNLNPVGLPMFECTPLADGSRTCQTSRYFSGFIGPKKFAMPKPAGTVRVFCLGESVAAGYPFFYPGSFARFMSVMLAESQTSFEVINLGVQGIRSADIRYLCREAVQYDPDWLILYMGNNEFLGLEPDKERGLRADLRDSLLRWLLPLRLRYIIGARLQAIDADNPGYDLLRSAVEAHEAMARRNWDDAARRDVTRRFDENLNAMVDMAEARGTRVMLATVAVNLRSFFPYRNDEKWPGADGCQAPPINTPAPSLTPTAVAERDQCDRDPAVSRSASDATEAYRLGCCSLWQNDLPSAREYFLDAAGRDRLLIRATPALNFIIRRTAEKRKVPLVDVEAIFAANSEWGIPGDDLFLDQVHPDLPGAALIARSLVRGLANEKVLTIDAELFAGMQRAETDYIRSIPPSFLFSSYFTDAGHVVRFGCFTRAARLYRKAADADPSQTEAAEAAERAESWTRSTASDLLKK